MTKERSSEILVDESWNKFLRKGKIGKNFQRPLKILLEIVGKSATGGNASLPQGGWTLLTTELILHAITDELYRNKNE